MARFTVKPLYQDPSDVTLMGVPSGTRTNLVGPVTAAIAEVLSERLGNGNRAELGRAAGIERSMMSKMLDGKKAITIDEFVAICQALRMSPQSVVRKALGRTDGRTDRPTDRPTDHSQLNRRRQAAEGQLALSARLGDGMTRSDAEPTITVEDDALIAQADRDIRAIKAAKRVKRGRRSG